MALGVAGGTGSGKTTVARAILDAVGADRLAFLAQDSYYRDVAWSSEAELHAHNFDHPDALDTPLLVAHLGALKAGHPVDVPV
ncbi:MAG TPA: uridine kinase, partial [Thermoanaerobaculia bacterium]|nr:uridine kinase [Thermoanaerobaculia bacterium]